MSIKMSANGVEKFDVFNAETKPLLGINTAQHPMTISEQVLATCTNARIIPGDQGSIIETRGGMTASLGTIIASGTYRGSWSGYLWGGYKIVMAAKVSTKTRIYISSDCATWTEMTDDAGPFGDTRLTGDAPVDFAVVPNPFALPSAVNSERLLASDGTGTVRNFASSFEQGGLSGETQKACLMNAVVAPQVGDLPVRVLTLQSTLLNLQGTPSYTTTSSGGAGHLTFASSGSSPEKVARLGIGASTVNNDVVSVTFSSSSLAVTTGDRQVIIGVSTAYAGLWDNMKVAMGSVVIWDPANPSTYARPIYIPVDSSNRAYWVFQYPTITASGALSGELAFTFVAGSAPSTAITADIFLLAITYGTEAFADWGIACTLASTSSLCESAGVIYSNYVTDKVADFGGALYGGLRLPRSPILKAQYSVQIKYPSTAETALGVDAYRFYYKKPGDARYRYMGTGSSIMGSVSGSTWTTGTQYVVTANSVVPSDLYSYPSVYLPDAYHIPPPSAKCLAFINDRLFIGGASSTNVKSFYVSESRNAFRMRTFTARQNGQVDPDAPITRTLGSGIFQKIVPMASSLLGADTVFILMSDRVAVTGGNTSDQLQNIAVVSQYGTVSPDSVKVYNNKLLYLDTEMQVQVLSGGRPTPISRDWVDNAFAAIPASRRAYVSSAIHNGRYYIAYSTSGATTNDRILVWDDAQGTWIGQDDPPVDTDGLIAWFDGTNNKRRLIAFGVASTNLNAYEYDLSTQSQDLGTTNIAVTLGTKEWMPRDVDKWWFIGRVGILADDVASGTATHVRTYKTEGSTGTSTASLPDTATGQLIKFDSDQTLSGAGIGPSYQLSLSISSVAGKRIYRWWCERELRDRPADA